MGYDFSSDERYQTDHGRSPVIDAKDKRIAELEAALKPFADAWNNAIRVAPTATLGQLGAVACYEVSGGYFQRAARLLAGGRIGVLWVNGERYEVDAEELSGVEVRAVAGLDPVIDLVVEGVGEDGGDLLMSDDEKMTLPIRAFTRPDTNNG